MPGVNNGYSSLANWNRGYENVSLPGQQGHTPASAHGGHPPAPVPPQLPTTVPPPVTSVPWGNVPPGWQGGMFPQHPATVLPPHHPGMMPPPPQPVYPHQLPATHWPAPIAPVPRYNPPPYPPPPGWGDGVGPPSRPPTAPPGSPPAEARGAMVFQDLDGFLHPGLPTTPGIGTDPFAEIFGATALEPAPRLPTPQPQPIPAETWLRPASPTYNTLKGNAALEKLAGLTWGTNIPAGIKEMTPEQAAATTLFKNNIEAYDPSGVLRAIGEFGQSYRPEAGGIAANADIHYMVGGAMYLPPASFRPETTQMIHSHPQDPSHINNYPSDADYYHAYFASKGNSNDLKGEIIYHPGSAKFYWYEPRLEEGASFPKFYELVNPYEAGPRSGNLESRRPLPDTSTYGEHFINWQGEQPPAA